MAGKEGILALWRGIGPALFSTGLTGAIRFGVQSAANRRLAESMGVTQFSELGLANRVLFEAVGGMAAGLVLPVFFTPIELVKVRQQTTQAQQQLSSYRVLRDAVRHEGVRGLYTGHSFTVWRSVIGNAFLFGPYEVRVCRCTLCVCVV